MATAHVGIPTIDAKLLLVRRADVDLRLGPVVDRDGDVDDDAARAVGVAVGRGDGPGASRRQRCVGIEHVVVGGRQSGQVGCALLIAPLGECRAAVEDQADHRDDRDQGQGEDDDDLAAFAFAVAMVGTLALMDGAPAVAHCWIENVLEDARRMLPTMLRIGVTG